MLFNTFILVHFYFIDYGCKIYTSKRKVCTKATQSQRRPIASSNA